MNSATASTSSLSFSSRQTTPLSHTPTSHRPGDSHELGSSLVRAQQTLYLYPHDELIFAPAYPGRPEAMSTFNARAPVRIVAPGRSDLQITAFAFQTLCDIVDGIRESISAARSFGTPVDDIKCTALGKVLETRMRELYKVPDFSVAAFAGITGLFSLIVDVPTATDDPSGLLTLDLQLFQRNTGLDTGQLCASTALTPYGQDNFSNPDAVPAIDVLHAFHAYRTSGGVQPSLPFIRGDRHRTLCAAYREAGLATTRDVASRESMPSKSPPSQRAPESM